MAMRSEEPGALKTDGAIAEGGAFGAAGYDADVLGHVRGEVLSKYF